MRSKIIQGLLAGVVVKHMTMLDLREVYVYPRRPFADQSRFNRLWLGFAAAGCIEGRTLDVRHLHNYVAGGTLLVIC